MLVLVTVFCHGRLQRDGRIKRLMSANGLSFEVPVVDFLLDFNMRVTRFSVLDAGTGLLASWFHGTEMRLYELRFHL